MASYKIEWKRSAIKDLKKLDRQLVSHVVSAVESLAENPRPANSKKLHGSEHIYRIRVQDYRVVYSIEDNILLIVIIKIGHRKDIYRGLK